MWEPDINVFLSALSSVTEINTDRMYCPKLLLLFLPSQILAQDNW